jgi:hypothetical protein
MANRITCKTHSAMHSYNCSGSLDAYEAQCEIVLRIAMLLQLLKQKLNNSVYPFLITVANAPVKPRETNSTTIHKHGTKNTHI